MSTTARPGPIGADVRPDAGRVRPFPAAPAAAAAEKKARVEARSAPRFAAAMVPSITGIRLSPFGADATLLNISATGVLVECTTRLRLGTAMTVVMEGAFSASVEGRVARSSVANVTSSGILRYHIGIAFNAPITLPRAASPAPAADTPPSPVSVTAVPVNRW